MGFLGPLIGAGMQLGGDLFGLLGNKPFGLEEGKHALDALQRAAIPEGMEATGRGLAYDTALLSGNPAAQAAAVAPQVNAASAQAQKAIERIGSEGTARGGGVNAELQQVGDIPSRTTIDTLTALQPAAAGRLEAAGSALTGQGASAASGEMGQATAQRGQTQDFLTNILNKMSLPTGAGQTPPISPGGSIFQAATAGGVPTEEIPSNTGLIPEVSVPAGSFGTPY